MLPLFFELLLLPFFEVVPFLEVDVPFFFFEVVPFFPVDDVPEDFDFPFLLFEVCEVLAFDFLAAAYDSWASNVAIASIAHISTHIIFLINLLSIRKQSYKKYS